jgi:hypothetical protein
MRNKKQTSLKIGRVLVGLALLASASVAAAQENTQYRPAPHDPFVKPKPIVRKKEKKKSVTVVEPPSIKARIDSFKERRAQAMSAQRPAPKPTTALLLGEVQITGIFRTPRGYAAMVEATPIKLSYVIYPGERFYDGQLVAIEEGRLVFRRERLWSDGRRETAVELKPLRAVAPADQLAAAAEKLAAEDKGAAKPKEKAEDSEEKPKPTKEQNR